MSMIDLVMTAELFCWKQWPFIKELYLLMELEERRTHSFFKGISLSEYMKDITCPEELGSENDN